MGGLAGVLWPLDSEVVTRIRQQRKPMNEYFRMRHSLRMIRFDPAMILPAPMLVVLWDDSPSANAPVGSHVYRFPLRMSIPQGRTAEAHAGRIRHGRRFFFCPPKPRPDFVPTSDCSSFPGPVHGASVRRYVDYDVWLPRGRLRKRALAETNISQRVSTLR